MSYDSRMQGLLQLVESDRSTKRADIVDGARKEACALSTQAHRHARELLRRAWREERERHARRIAAAEAELQTRRRAASQEHERALLARATSRLPDALTRRWSDPGHRMQWLRHAVLQASAMLAAGAWRIEHAPGLSDEEQRALAGELGTRGVDATFGEVESMRAGLRIVAGTTAIDATLDGLVGDDEEIGARLLALIEAAP